MNQPDKEERIAVKLVLDADAAAMLPELAGSPRKQGEYVSKLIRQAAVQRATAPSIDPMERLRQELLGAASQLSTLTKHLVDMATQAKPEAIQSEDRKESNPLG